MVWGSRVSGLDTGLPNVPLPLGSCQDSTGSPIHLKFLHEAEHPLVEANIPTFRSWDPMSTYLTPGSVVPFVVVSRSYWVRGRRVEEGTILPVSSVRSLSTSTYPVLSNTWKGRLLVVRFHFFFLPTTPLEGPLP